MQWLIIKTTSLEATKADYALLTATSETVQFTSSNWTAIKDHIGNSRVILLIPSEEVGLHQVTLPTANKKQMAKAIPFALEDSLAEDIDDLHFSFQRAPADINSNENTVNVATMNTQRIQQWQDILQQEHGIKLHAILPDFFSLPADETTSSLMVHQERALYRHDSFLGISCTLDLLPILLPSFINSKNDNSHITSEDDAETEVQQVPTLLLDIPSELTLDIPEQLHVESTNKLHNHCHSSLLAALPLNLLTGFGNSEKEALLKQLSKWKTAAILAVLIALLWGATTAYQNHRSQQYLQQLNTAITNIYKETLPNASIDSDYRVNHQVMEEKLKALGVSAPKAPSPLEPIALIAPLLKQNKSITLKKLSIDNNELILAITATSVAQLETFHAAINKNVTLQAEIKSQSTSGNKVIAKLSIRKKKP